MDVCAEVGSYSDNDVTWTAIQFKFFVDCDQAALRTLLSVRPSVRLNTFFAVLLSSDHHELLPLINVHAKGQGQRSNAKVTEVKTNFAPI